MVVIGQGCYQARLSTSLVWRFFSKLTNPGAIALWSVSRLQMVDGCCHRFSHLSCSCPSCLSLGEALSGRWVDLSFSLCGRSACVSLYFLGIVERSQAGHLGTGASGRQTPQAPGTSTTFSTLFSRQPPQCKYCTTDGETSEEKVFGSVTQPVTSNHVIPVHDHQLQRVSHVEWSSLEYTSTKYQFRNLTIRGRVGSGGINSERFYHLT